MLVLKFGKHAVVHYAGVEDDTVRSAVCRDPRIERGLRLLPVRYVKPQYLACAAKRLHGIRHFLRSVNPADAMQNRIVSGARKTKRRRPPDAAAGTGYYDLLHADSSSLSRKIHSYYTIKTNDEHGLVF